MEDTVRYKKDLISTITIYRSEQLNALNQDVLKGLLEAFDKVEDASKVIILKGDGEKAFVAGADITSMSSLGEGAIRDYIELGQKVMRRIESCSVPVIAQVQGFALGGGLELALACDLIVASEKAKVGQPEVNLGIIPGFGGTARLVQRAGVGVARRLIYTGDLISASEALNYGVVDIVTPHEELDSTVTALAKRISEKGPLAVKKAKAVIRSIFEPTLHNGLRSEVEGFVELFDSKDREEGMRAFLQKRSPVFEGK